MRGAEEDYFQQIEFFKIKVKAVLFNFAGTATCKVRDGKIHPVHYFTPLQACNGHSCVQKACKPPERRWVRHSPCSRGRESEWPTTRQSCGLNELIFIKCFLLARHYFILFIYIVGSMPGSILEHSALSSSVLRRRWTSCRAQRQKDGSHLLISLHSAPIPSHLPSVLFRCEVLWIFFFFSNSHNNCYTDFLLILFMQLLYILYLINLISEMLGG